ncbi:hypothetical protein [Streptomyces sp. NPDC059009]|uniref:hypothetical protein n=1 Tax=Streptomyces sp. NPDC059009 TaxID=3346694 RepID=UPI0036B85ACD
MDATEYPYAISDIAHRVAELLGPRWGSEAGSWGVTGKIHTPHGDTLVIGIDYEDDLYVNGPTSLEPVYLESETAPQTPEELTTLAKVVASIVREIA